MKKRVSVRTLVESVMLSGDLSVTSSVSRMLEGAMGHRLLQAAEEDGVKNEVTVSARFTSTTFLLTVHGRIDRLREPDTVEEIKTTYNMPESAEAVNPRHLAQAKCYAYMLCETNELDAATVRMTYFDLDTGEVQPFDFRYTADELSVFMRELVEPYLLRLELAQAHLGDLSAEITATPFPYPAYRDGQRRMIGQVYASIKKRSPILIEAPTGTGKTVSVLYPALKALSEGEVAKIFFLSSRTTGQNAAIDAITRLDIESLRTIIITAKDKVCVNEERLCARDECPRQIGYYDRLGAALLDLRASGETLFTQDILRNAADLHHICPFELSLDFSLECDVIICDYNYCFDPRIRLQRYFGDAKCDCALLVDEAHSLVSRSREMYSAKVSFFDIAELKKSIPENRRKTAQYRLLTSLLRTLRDAFGEAGERAEQEAPAAIARIVETTAEMLRDPPDFINRELAKSVYFDLACFVYFLSKYDADYVTLYEGEGRFRSIRLFCACPAARLHRSYDMCKTAVLFSATLSPYGFYRDLLGLPGDAPTLALKSPFPEENCRILYRPLSTRFAAREATMPRVASACAALVSSRTTGNFMLFLPSYSYLYAFAELFAKSVNDPRFTCPEYMLFTEEDGVMPDDEDDDSAASDGEALMKKLRRPSPEKLLRMARERAAKKPPARIDFNGVTMRLAIQTRNMTDAERADFLALFSDEPDCVTVGMAVCGGVFAESIDLSGEKLCGAAIVGVGLPSLSLERNTLREAYDKEYHEGYRYAYMYPGISKVLQAAGRVIRTETDRGCILLIDDRYSTGEYLRLLPDRWSFTQADTDEEIFIRCRDFYGNK